jgi:hypothetical protein
MNSPESMMQGLEFEEQIKNLPDRQLLEYVARQQFQMVSRCVVCTNELADVKKDVASLKAGDRKSSAVSGGVTGSVTAIIIALGEWLIRR